MEMLAIRTRMVDPRPLYAYRVYVPFHQISPERQALIHYRTNFGHFRSGDHFARLADVIAPMAHLQRPPGFDRYVEGRDLHRVADRLEAIIIGHVFPEMTAKVSQFPRLVPLRHQSTVSIDPPPARLKARA